MWGDKSLASVKDTSGGTSQSQSPFCMTEISLLRSIAVPAHSCFFLSLSHFIGVVCTHAFICPQMQISATELGSPGPHLCQGSRANRHLNQEIWKSLKSTFIQYPLDVCSDLGLSRHAGYIQTPLSGQVISKVFSVGAKKNMALRQ